MFPNATKIYNVYIKESDIDPIETTEFVEEGFSLYALIFGIFWGFANKLPSFIILSLLVQITSSFLLFSNQMDIISIYIIQITANIMLAFEANNMRCARLKRKKYVFCDIVVGRNLLEAQQRFFDRYIDDKNRRQNVASHISDADASVSGASSSGISGTVNDGISKDAVTI